eukprot:GHVN01072991.1.p3 GENE.GHVN01072991.1~~GHVN01072991.1.p3  ORF type:complete len:119 (+),score=12.96 GHVN01072991.1:557-913(+)
MEGIGKSGREEDASEFLVYLLNRLHDECKWRKIEKPHSLDGFKSVDSRGKTIATLSAGDSDDSPIKRLVGGRMVHTSVKGKAVKKHGEFFFSLNLAVQGNQKLLRWVAVALYTIRNDW